MIEPTESESLAELDRFCDAMIAIRAEIDHVADGTWPGDDNPLRNAPHTAARGRWRRLGPPVPPFARRLADRRTSARPSTGRRSAASTAATATATWCARARRSRISREYGPLADRAPSQCSATKGSSTQRAGTCGAPHVDAEPRRRARRPGSTKASAIPHPSTGEKLPELIRPTVYTVTQHRLIGSRRPATLDAQPT